MAQDDMYVVMYRIMAYIYDCMKRGVEPENGAWDAGALAIPQPYWAHIVRQLVERGYLTGVNVSGTYAGTNIVVPNCPRVTMEGVAFMQENSMMARAVRFLKEAKASIPGL